MTWNVQTTTITVLVPTSTWVGKSYSDMLKDNMSLLQGQVWKEMVPLNKTSKHNMHVYKYG